MYRNDSQEPEASIPVNAEGTQLRCLIVDDEPDLREITQDLLEHLGCLVDQAQDGTEALKMIQDHQYDFVFTDFRMPGMTGQDLIRKARPITSVGTRFVLVTGGERSDLEPSESDKTNVDVFISKPFSITDLMRALRR